MERHHHQRRWNIGKNMALAGNRSVVFQSKKREKKQKL
jgi:hypothetical protein